MKIEKEDKNAKEMWMATHLLTADVGEEKVDISLTVCGSRLLVKYQGETYEISISSIIDDVIAFAGGDE